VKLSPKEHDEFMHEEMKEPEHKKLASMVKGSKGSKFKGAKGDSMVKRETKFKDGSKKSGFLKKNAGFKLGKKSSGRE
jgi:hypothetical protein